MEHLAKITLANLPAGCVNPTEKQIISAMLKAVAKEADMAIQLYESRDKIGGKLDQFASIMSGLIKEAI